MKKRKNLIRNVKVLENKNMKKGQIWVETVIYTLIALVLIAIVIAVAKPKIDEYRDEALISQTIVVLGYFDREILDAKQAPGNVRIPELMIKKGRINIKGAEDIIEYVLEDSKKEYSEPGVVTKIGNVNVITEKNKTTTIRIYLNYTDVNITYNGEDREKSLQAASSPYKIKITNYGIPEDGNLVNIDLMEIS